MSTKSFEQLVGERAYQLFLARGGVHGYAHEDWNQAEKEIRAEMKKGVKPAAAEKVTATAPMAATAVVRKKPGRKPKAMAAAVAAPAFAAPAAAKVTAPASAPVVRKKPGRKPNAAKAAAAAPVKVKSAYKGK